MPVALVQVTYFAQCWGNWARYKFQRQPGSLILRSGLAFPKIWMVAAADFSTHQQAVLFTVTLPFGQLWEAPSWDINPESGPWEHLVCLARAYTPAHTCRLASQQAPKLTGFRGSGSQPLKLEYCIVNILCAIHKNAENGTTHHSKGVTGASWDYPSPNLQVTWHPATSQPLNLTSWEGSVFILPCAQPRCSAGSSACEPAPRSLSRSSSPSPWHPQTPWRNGTRTPRYPRSRPTASLGASPWAGPCGCSHSWTALLHGRHGWWRSPPRRRWRRRWKRSLGYLQDNARSKLMTDKALLACSVQNQLFGQV